MTDMDDALDKLEENEENKDVKEQTDNVKKEEPETKEETKKIQIEDKKKDTIESVIETNQKKKKLPSEFFQESGKSYFNKFKLAKNEKDFPKEQLKKFIASYGYFNCKTNCKEGELSCPECMKLNQKYYGLRPNYLVNDKGRICTFKNNKIYCKGKLTKEVFIGSIKYTYDYVCGHSGQCKSCQELTQVMNKYFDPDLLKKLSKRDARNK